MLKNPVFEVRSGEEEYDGGCVGVGEVDCGRGGVGRLPPGNSGEGGHEGGADREEVRTAMEFCELLSQAELTTTLGRTVYHMSLRL